MELDAGSGEWVLAFLIPKPVTLNSTLSPMTYEPVDSSPVASQSEGIRVWHIRYATAPALFTATHRLQTEVRRGDHTKEV